MNPRLDPSNLSGSGAPPPAPSGLRHLAPWVKVLAGGGIAATVSVYVLQVGLPDGWRPSSVAGDAAGDTVRHEIEAMKEAKIDMERRIADATAQANAKAQADVIAITKAAEERTASLAPVSAMAGLADAACIGARMVSAFTQPGWNRSPSDDFYYAAQKTGAATCGRGDGLRQEVTRSQLNAVHEAAASRGAPMTDGAVRTISARPAPDPAPREIPPTQIAVEPRQSVVFKVDNSHPTATPQARLRHVFIPDADRGSQPDGGRPGHASRLP